jgi:hypothetical protein
LRGQVKTAGPEECRGRDLIKWDEEKGQPVHQAGPGCREMNPPVLDGHARFCKKMLDAENGDGHIKSTATFTKASK